MNWNDISQQETHILFYYQFGYFDAEALEAVRKLKNLLYLFI